jgi:hypothetical protein
VEQIRRMTMVKIKSGGGLTSNKLREFKDPKREPVTHKGNPAGVAQTGLAHQFKPQPMTSGKGYEPKGPTSNMGQGPGANRVIYRSGSQSPTPAPKQMEKGTDILSQFGPEATGKR